MRWVYEALCWAFGIVFIWAGWVKALEPATFLTSVRGFRILGDPYEAWLALGLPWLEIFAGLAVLTGWLRRGGLLLLNASLLIFAAVLISAWVRDLDVNCGCFGRGSVKTTIVDGLIRDFILLGVGGWLWWSRHGRSTRAADAGGTKAEATASSPE